MAFITQLKNEDVHPGSPVVEVYVENFLDSLNDLLKDLEEKLLRLRNKRQEVSNLILAAKGQFYISEISGSYASVRDDDAYVVEQDFHNICEQIDITTDTLTTAYTLQEYYKRCKPKATIKLTFGLLSFICQTRLICKKGDF